MGTEQREEIEVFKTHKLSVEFFINEKSSIILLESECNLPTADRKNLLAALENSKFKMINH